MKLTYRIWDTENKEYSTDCERFSVQPNGHVVDWYDGEEARSQDSYVVEQKTGFEDKNGKDIYDGDIIKIDDCPRAIEFGNTMGWCFKGSNYEHPLFNYSNEDFEIIGNIHENSSLLK